MFSGQWGLLCTRCNNCNGCSGCVNCTSCNNCNNCVSCVSCVSCDNCRNCISCTNCKNLVNCIGCTGQNGNLNSTEVISAWEETPVSEEQATPAASFPVREEELPVSSEHDEVLWGSGHIKHKYLHPKMRYLNIAYYNWMLIVVYKFFLFLYCCWIAILYI